MSLPYQDMFDASAVGISKKERMLEHTQVRLLSSKAAATLYFYSLKTFSKQIIPKYAHNTHIPTYIQTQACSQQTSHNDKSHESAQQETTVISTFEDTTLRDMFSRGKDREYHFLFRKYFFSTLSLLDNTPTLHNGRGRWCTTSNIALHDGGGI